MCSTLTTIIGVAIGATVVRCSRIRPTTERSTGTMMTNHSNDQRVLTTLFCSRQVLDDGNYGGQITDVNNCLGSSAEFELALILKELRWITDQVSGLCPFTTSSIQSSFELVL